MFLDYDGTLTPIVSDPDAATLSDHMRDAVGKLSDKATVAIVSGRAREKLRNFVQLPELYYAGSHGFDIDGPGGIGAASSLFYAVARRGYAVDEASDCIPGARVDGVAATRASTSRRRATATPAPRSHIDSVRPPRRHRRGRERVPTGTPSPRELAATASTRRRPQASATP